MYLKSTLPCSTVGLNSAFGKGAGSVCALISSAASLRLDTGYMSIPSTYAASAAFSLGRIIRFTPRCCASIVIGRTPRAARTLPSRPSSPMNTVSSQPRMDTSPETAISAIAIGRSYMAFSLRTSAGARFITILSEGKSNPLFTTAARTLSLDSLTARTGSPTMFHCGIPGE